jgi:hypothetical protein
MSRRGRFEQKFNVRKCKTMRLNESYQTLHIQGFFYDLHIRSENIVCVHFFKDFIRFWLQVTIRNLTRFKCYEAHNIRLSYSCQILSGHTRFESKETYSGTYRWSYLTLYDLTYFLLISKMRTKSLFIIKKYT